jgi:hypothetical protein
MRRFAFILLAASLAAAACGGGTATSNPGGGGGTQAPAASTGGGGGGGAANWSGNGSAQVTIGGTTVTVSPGGCYDGGSLGVDFRFGNWENPTTANWIMGIAHRDGSKSEAITGGVNGKMFVLGADAVATIGADGKGTFSGTDSAGGNGKISGTFSCT